jgi:signal transduction histidine kinase
VDQRLYPRRHAVRAALEQLHARVEQGRAEPEDLEQTLRAALRDPGLRVGYQRPGQHGLVDRADIPLPADAPGTCPVLLSGHPVGALLPGAPGGSRQLLREAATAGAVFVALNGSRLQLRRALDEVAASRARLLRAGYEERRRLERDLHDGAQQRLVSVGMALRLAQRHLADGTLDIDGLIDQSVAELGTAVAELRTIAHGLRPASLSGGLAPAIRALSTAVPLAVRLEVCDEPVPDDVATTAYYIASEALTNVVKHADATAVDLRVVREDGRLRIRVADDGRGGIRPHPGSGLAGLADRVAAAGGSVSFAAGRPQGTVVEAVLPCAR